MNDPGFGIIIIYYLGVVYLRENKAALVNYFEILCTDDRVELLM